MKRNAGSHSQPGFTLIELMIAITLSLIILLALTAVFVTSSRARDEITRANQQIENGRYAMQVLSDDLKLAGYFGGLKVSDVAPTPPNPPPNSCIVPNPTATDNDSVFRPTLALHIHGYDEGDNPDDHCESTGDFASDNGLLPGYKAGTDVLVIRRVSTCIASDLDPDCPDDAGQLYFQASFCNTQLINPDVEKKYRLGAATFDRRLRGPTGSAACGAVAPKRRFMTHIYYIGTDDVLKRVELRNGDFDTITPLVEGIEQLEIEYGIDTDNDGAPDGSFVSNPASNAWDDVMTVRINLLARSTDASPGHTDAKTYTLAGQNFTPGGSYKRHAFQSLVRLSNPAGLRQQ